MNHNFNSSNVDCPAKLAGELIDIIVKPFFSNIGSYIVDVVATMLKNPKIIKTLVTFVNSKFNEKISPR